MVESEELKSLLMKVKEESEKVDLQQNIQKTKIMASGPITSWQIDRETMETETDIFFPFYTVHGVLKARILKRFAIPFSKTLHHDPSILGGPTQHGS